MALEIRTFVTIFLGILCAAISPVVLGQSLTSTLENGQFACRGSRVTFTCVTRGSGEISWTSDTYIGPNGAQLIFEAEFDNPGDIRTSLSNGDTVATLTGEQEDQEVTVLESTLSINPLPDPQNASVTCIHTDSGQRSTITFQVIGAPGTLQNVFPVPIEHSEGNCVIHTVWNSLNHFDATQYEILANGTLMSADTDVIDIDVNVARISALFLITCGVYNISISATNACGQTPLVSNIIPRTPPHFIDELDLPTSQSTNTDNEGSLTTGPAIGVGETVAMAQNCDSYMGAIIGVSVVLGLLCLGLIIVVIILLVILCCCEKRPIISATPIKKNKDLQFKESEMTEKTNHD